MRHGSPHMVLDRIGHGILNLTNPAGNRHDAKPLGRDIIIYYLPTYLCDMVFLVDIHHVDVTIASLEMYVKVIFSCGGFSCNRVMLKPIIYVMFRTLRCVILQPKTCQLKLCFGDGTCQLS